MLSQQFTVHDTGLFLVTVIKMYRNQLI